jgi:3-deoxy-D-manno-octulosonate 8-phosphate phosphatase (KDO 8-P phosphatase)
MEQPQIKERCARIKLLLMDCDGVLTDGRIWLFENGEEQKGFHTRDGLGIYLWHSAGFKSGIISGRTSSAVERRAHELGMSFIHQGGVDKHQAYRETLAQAGLRSEEVAYVGDDLNDIPLMMRSGLGVAVADAAAEARVRAHYVTKAAGGQGVIREVVELILESQGRWEDLVKHFLTADPTD